MEEVTGLIVSESNTLTLPVAYEAKGDNYELIIPTTGQRLNFVRDVDFGKIKGTEKPCLYKAGAERILMSYGVSSQFTIEACVEDFPRDAEGFLKQPLFFYRVRCTLTKALADGRSILITEGFGSASSMEKACGTASPWDTGNARLKIAKKRAMVDAVLTLGQLSSLFAQDIENDEFLKEKSAEKIAGKVLSDEERISQARINRLYAIAGSNGFSREKAKAMLKSAGFESAKDITNKDYDDVCAMFGLRTEEEEGKDDGDN